MADCTGLENRHGVTHPGFESLSLRLQPKGLVASLAAGLLRFLRRVLRKSLRQSVECILERIINAGVEVHCHLHGAVPHKPVQHGGIALT